MSFAPFATAAEICDVGRISGSLSGADVYTVTTATGAFVLRIQGEPHAAWSRTIALQGLASDVGVAPRLAWVDEARTIAPTAMIASRRYRSIRTHTSAAQSPHFGSSMSGRET